MPVNHNIKSIPNFTNELLINSSFGQKIEACRNVKPWLESENTKVGYLDCKRKSIKSALREFKKLYDVKEYWMQYPDQTSYYQDDSIKIYYQVK